MGAVVELVGVPFDGFGRAGHQAAAPDALRAAGLRDALGPRGGHDEGDLVLPPPEAHRGATTSLLNETALLAMVSDLGARVAAAVGAERFPLVHGGDCTTLLGTIPALAAQGPVGLVFLDGHEDTMPLDSSEDGEGANAEIGLLLGLTGRTLAGPLGEGLPALRRDDLAVLGPRDDAWRHRFNVGTLADAGVWLRDAGQLAADPAGEGRSAARHVAEAVGRWWLHVDLDVLDPREFAGQGVPGDPGVPGGVDWSALTDALVAAVGVGGCLGWSIAVYDPELDPDGHEAARVVALVSSVLAALP